MKKRIGLLIVILLSLFVNVNKVDAVVMWAQCDTIKFSAPYSNYYEKERFDKNAYFIVNSKSHEHVRHMFYKSSNPNVGNVYNQDAFYGTFIYYKGSDKGKVSGKLCWYDKEYDDWYISWGTFDTAGIAECDRKKGLIDINELLYNGSCPVGMNAGAGQDRDPDQAVLYGVQEKNMNSAVLNENIFVMYPFKDENAEDDEVYWMIEAYTASESGKYSWASTFSDWNKFYDGLGVGNAKMNVNDVDETFSSFMKKAGSSKYLRNDNVLNWSAFTQVLRVANIGRDYFQLLKNPKSWMINIMPDDKRNFELVEKINVENTNGTTEEIDAVFYSDDRNENFLKFIADWYKEQDPTIKEQLNAIANIENENGTYKKVLDVANNIKSNGNSYFFDDSYNATEFLDDAEEFVAELKRLYELEQETKYTFYREDCEPFIGGNDDNAATVSMLETFTCNYFGTSTFQNISNGVAKGKLANQVGAVLTSKFLEYNQSSIGPGQIRTKLKEYITLMRDAMDYVSDNGNINSEIDNGVLDNIISDLESMGESYGMQFVYECSDLISEPLRKKIEYYMDLVKIIIPIILIGFGVIDFTKAIFSDNDDAMKKAQTDFIKRIAIAIVFFFIPVIVNIILLTANKVWYFIDPTSGSCIEEK